jgi:hypothetical protein
MLGGGNPVGGSNPSGIGSSINFIGNHVYGYSGTVTSSTGTTKTMLEFVVPSNSYIDATIQFGSSQQRFNDDEVINMYIDDQLAAGMLFNNNYERAELDSFQVILAPDARVKIEVVKQSGTADVPFLAWIRGRVYA